MSKQKRSVRKGKRGKQNKEIERHMTKMACERVLEASVQTDRFKRIKRRRREILKKETDIMFWEG